MSRHSRVWDQCWIDLNRMIDKQVFNKQHTYTVILKYTIKGMIISPISLYKYFTRKKYYKQLSVLYCDTEKLDFINKHLEYVERFEHVYYFSASCDYVEQVDVRPNDYRKCIPFDIFCHNYLNLKSYTIQNIKVLMNKVTIKFL